MLLYSLTMVIESIVAKILNKFLGDYFSHIDGSNVNTTFTRGNIVLTNLHLKKTIPQQLFLPFTLLEGSVGELTIRIPWRHLDSKPLSIGVKDVRILVTSTSDLYDKEREEAIKWLQRRSKMRTMEKWMTRNRVKEGKKKDKEEGFLEKRLRWIAMNLKVSVENFHLRFDGEEESDDERSFSTGVTWKHALLQTSDERKSCEDADEVCKTFDLEKFGFYWESNEYEKRNSDVAGGLHTENYIIQPMDISTKIHLNAIATGIPSDEETPKLSANVDLKETQIFLARSQADSILNVMQMLDRKRKAHPYREFHPRCSVKGHVKEWWKFAITSVLLVQVRKFRETWKWESIAEYRGHFRKYKEYYEQKVKGRRKAGKNFLEQLWNVEEMLNVESVILLRRLVQDEVLKSKGITRTESDSTLLYPSYTVFHCSALLNTIDVRFFNDLAAARVEPLHMTIDQVRIELVRRLGDDSEMNTSVTSEVGDFCASHQYRELLHLAFRRYVESKPKLDPSDFIIIMRDVLSSVFVSSSHSH